jgi:hypothetical protein
MAKVFAMDRVRYRIEAKQRWFANVGYRAVVEADGVELDKQCFYGLDGRKVRAEAKRWAEARAKLFAR